MYRFLYFEASTLTVVLLKMPAVTCQLCQDFKLIPADLPEFNYQKAGHSN